jgi:stress-induced morphogen
MILGSDIRDLLLTAFPDAHLELVDMTGSRDHYALRIATAAFDGKSGLEQHQLVYRALGDALDGPIHALSLQTYTHATWPSRLEGSS